MKALVLEQYKELALRDVPDPAPADGEVTVRVRACAICGSDVHGWDGSTGRRVPPVVMGHEAAGVIERIGRGVTAWKPGDIVTFDSTVSCGRCPPCRAGRINLCDNRRVLGVSCDEYRRDGAMAELVAVPEHILYRVPAGMPLVRAALVEPLSIAVHAVARTPVAIGDCCVVVGAGNIGLLLVQVLRARGAGKVIAVDTDEARLRQALALGADEAVPASGDTARAVAERSGGRGADRAFEAVGLAETLGTALACVRKGGSVTLVGNLTPRVEFAQQYAVTREIDLLSSCASSGEYLACLDLIARGKVDVQALVSHVVPLAEGAAWFRRLYAREPGVGKVVLEP
jgi:L-iditol 2-dehydrogenase